MMTNEGLIKELKNINLDECTPIIPGHIYYCKKDTEYYTVTFDGPYNHEYLIITNGEEKQAIISRIGTEDLHWVVLEQWRGQHVLSNALRTGVIGNIWSKNKYITCESRSIDPIECYNKLEMTKHFADIAGLKLKKYKSTKRMLEEEIYGTYQC